MKTNELVSTEVIETERINAQAEEAKQIIAIQMERVRSTKRTYKMNKRQLKKMLAMDIDELIMRFGQDGMLR